MVMLAAFALAAPAAAGESARQVAMEPSAAEPSGAEPLLMDQVVVSASRFEEPAASVPNRVVVVGRGEVEESASADLGELLMGRSSFDVRTQGNPGSLQSISIRGASTNQVLVMVDGRPINSATTGMANLSEVSLDYIDHVEVIEGPYSHLYGSGAVGGVVNVITRQPPKELASTAAASYGSANTQLYQLSTGDTAGPFGFLLMGGARYSDGFRANSDLSAYDAAGKFTLQAGQVGLSLFSVVHRDEIGTPGPVPGPAGAAPLGDSQVTNLTTRNRNHLINNTLCAETSPSEGVVLRARLFQDWRELEDFGRQGFFNMNTFATDYDPYHDKFDTSIFGGSLEGEFTKGVSRLTVGSDWHYDKVDVHNQHTDVSGATLVDPGIDRDRTQAGFFVRERLQLLKPLALFLGGRLDYDTAFGQRVSPEAGLTLTLGRTTLRSSVAEVYRAPTFNDLYWPADAFGDHGNPNLRPEKGWSAEAGMRTELVPGRLSADLSFFRRDMRDEINWQPIDPTNPFSGWMPMNADRERTLGTTASLTARPSEKLELQASYTYLDAWVTEAGVMSRATLVPRHQVCAEAAYTLRKGTRVWARFLYLSDRFSGASVLHPLNLLSAGASQALGKHLEAFLQAENALDKSYSLQVGYPAPPLSFLGGLRFRI
jgi:outer membrane cobalamin receptor